MFDVEELRGHRANTSQGKPTHAVHKAPFQGLHLFVAAVLRLKQLNINGSAFGWGQAGPCNFTYLCSKAQIKCLLVFSRRKIDYIPQRVNRIQMAYKTLLFFLEAVR